MKKVQLQETQRHPKGDIPKGSIYIFNPETNMYEYKKNGLVVSMINESGIDMLNHLFERI